MALYSDVTFTDEAGTHIPLLTRHQSSQLANAMLQQAAAKALKKSVEKDQRTEIAAIALGNRRDRHDALNKLLLQEPEKGSEGSKLTPLGESPFAELACMMATHSPVVCLFTDGPPGRSIVKISYTEPTDEESSPSRGRVRRSIGWKSEFLSVRVNEIGASASHHLEIDIPGELQVNSVALTGKRYISANKRWRDLSFAEKDYSIRQVGTATSGSIYVTESPYPRRMGRIAIKMRARRSGFLLGALVVSVIMTLVLAVLSLTTPEIIGVVKSDGTIATLLLLPSVVAAYIARPGEHMITARMLRWARFALVGNAALPFLAVLILLTTPEASSTNPGLDLGGFIESLLGIIKSQDSPTNGLEARWALLAGISALFTCLFIVSNIWPRPHGESRYSPMPSRIDS